MLKIEIPYFKAVTVSHSETEDVAFKLPSFRL